MKHKLPDCHLVEILSKKSDERNDIDFDYVTRLEDLRHRIASEVRFINALFPEYTPHDEEYHLTRLFHVADTIVERKLYENMNATELFVLGCGLYGHDWGMAVSVAEKSYILSGVVPDGFSATDFALLHDEHKACERFMLDRGVPIENVKSAEVPIEDWREYVRKTHAWRSGARMRHYFQAIDSGAGDAAGRVCEGHWLNIEDLENSRSYPVNFAVLRENLNLAALAVYVRLVDLLDIGHDRTPYVIWKFVAPRDRYSKLEWDKHRALQPITCPPYLKGRVVLVDGSTDDHEVYAALEDLHNYCEQQIRECMNLLARIGDPRHSLDLYHVEWRVGARGFDPVLIRFEFDRDRVFEILSDEIYQGDPYVFLRELLQNSIDAIRMRRELLQRAGIMASNYGLIRVEVEHGSKGDTRIIWTDDGVGMDSHIVRNYLSVAGRSYYRSEEFEKQGLTLDPISKFGIGILSCFMAADLVEIETARDPYAKPSGSALRIQIPAVGRQFRIEQVSALDFGIGTRVVVNVEGRRLPEGTGTLDVTRYLKTIAGFVEFPILVSESGKNTLILHPSSPITPTEDFRFKNYSALEVHKLDSSYPFDEVFLLQDVEKAKTVLVEERFDLRTDLGLENYEGVISCAVPKNVEWLAYHWDQTDAEGMRIETGGEEVILRWKPGWNHHGSNESKLARSASPALTYSVFRNGVLVPGADIAIETDEMTYRHRWPVMRLTVNLIGASASEPDIARIELKAEDQHWFSPIRNALETNLRSRLVNILLANKPLNSFTEMGTFSIVFRVPERFLLNLDQQSLVPVAMLAKNGEIHITTWGELNGKPINLVPAILDLQLRDLLYATVRQKEYTGYLKKWDGIDAAVLGVYGIDRRIERSIHIGTLLLHHLYYPAEAIFLVPPVAGLPPLVQEVWIPKGQSPDRSIQSIAEQAMNEPSSLSGYEITLLVNQESSRHQQHLLLFPLGTESRPYSAMTQAVFRGSIYNLGHPLVGLLVRSFAWLRLTDEKKNDISRALLSEAAVNLLRSTSRSPQVVSALARSLVSIATKVGLVQSSSIPTEIQESELWYTEEGFEFDARIKDSDQRFGQLLET